MLNKIVIDKFKIMISEKSIENYLNFSELSIESLLKKNKLSNNFIKEKDKPLKQLEDTYNKILSLYFLLYSFFCYRRYSRFYISFNPTRAYKEDNVNLQMIPHDIFLNLLEKLGLLNNDSYYNTEITNTFQIVEMHLTKTFKVSNNVTEDYIPMLLTEIPTRNLFSPVHFQSIESDSVYFHRLTKKEDNEKKYTNSKIIKFYDKKNQLRKKCGANIKLREPLNTEEIELLKDHYDKNTKTLTLNDNLNLLRIELAYTSKSVWYIHQKLIGNENWENIRENKNISNKLPLNVLTDCLKDKNLYEKLDSIFTNEVNKSIFCSTINSATDNEITNRTKQPYCKRVASYVDLDKNDLLYLKTLLKDIGYTNSEINKKLLPFINKNENNIKYYNELKDLINTPVDYNDSNYLPQIYQPLSSNNHTECLIEEDTDILDLYNEDFIYEDMFSEDEDEDYLEED